MIKEIDVESISEELSDGIKIVYVSAPWCGQCKMNKKAINEISEEMQISIFEMDVDTNKLWKDDNNETFKIMSIPTFLGYKEGEEVFRETGFKTKNQLTDLVNKLK